MAVKSKWGLVLTWDCAKCFICWWSDKDYNCTRQEWRLFSCCSMRFSSEDKTGISRRKYCIPIMVVTAQISSVHGKDLCLKKELSKQPAYMDFVWVVRMEMPPIMLSLSNALRYSNELVASFFPLRCSLGLLMGKDEHHLLYHSNEITGHIRYTFSNFSVLEIIYYTRVHYLRMAAGNFQNHSSIRYTA